MIARNPTNVEDFSVVDVRERDSAPLPGVLDVIRSRLAGESDNYVLALAVDGGGLRGVVSGAMLIALRDLGVDKVVDRFYGSSAAALNLAEYAVGASWDALAVYYDYLPAGLIRKFPDYLGKPLLDMGYLDGLLTDHFPIPAEKLKSSALDVRVVLTDVESCAPVVKSARDDPADIIQLLKASAWLPILSGSPVLYQGRRSLDGGILMAHPLYAAVEEGCTHVLAASPKPYRPPSPWRRQTALRAVLNRWEAGLGDAYVASRERWEADCARLEQGESRFNGASVLRMAPVQGVHQVGRLTTDRGELLEGARVGYSFTREFFGEPVGSPYFTVTN